MYEKGFVEKRIPEKTRLLPQNFVQKSHLIISPAVAASSLVDFLVVICLY